MFEISLLDLIRNEQFGPIRLGYPKEKVVKLLGIPDGLSNPDFNPELYDAIFYGNWEFNFRKNELNSISHHYVLSVHTFRFDRKFHYKNAHFKITSWLRRPWLDGRIKDFTAKLTTEGIEYNLNEYLDSMKMKIGDNIEILFSSKATYHKEPELWIKIDPKILKLRFSHFFLFKPDN